MSAVAFYRTAKHNTCVLLILIAAQVLLFNLNDETYAIWDQSYYLAYGDLFVYEYAQPVQSIYR